MVDGDWNFRNDIEQCNTLTPDYRQAALNLPLTETGRIPNKYGVGWSVVTLPFYIIADVLVSLLALLGVTSFQHDGFNAIYQICIQLGHFGLAIVSIMLATRVVALWLDIDRWCAASGVCLVWFASPLLYYQTVNLSMSHGVAFFSVALLAFSLEGVRVNEGSWRNWVMAGVAWGLMVVTRYQLGVFGLPVLALVVVSIKRSWCWGVMDGVAFLAGAVPLLALQLWAWHVVYGRWIVFSYGSEGESFNWFHPEVVGLLFSPFHGLFYWHPLLLIACIGLVIYAWRETVWLGWAWVAAVVIIAYVNASWHCWWFASSFGSRAFDAAILPMMAGFAFLFVRLHPTWRGLLLWLAVGAGAWNYYLVWLYRLGAIPRNAPVTWSQMISAAGKISDTFSLF